MSREVNPRISTTALYGVSEASELLGVSKQAFSNWRSRGWLPRPIAELRSGPIWTQEQIDFIVDKRKRLEQQELDRIVARDKMVELRLKRAALKAETE